MKGSNGLLRCGGEFTSSKEIVTGVTRGKCKWRA